MASLFACTETRSRVGLFPSFCPLQPHWGFPGSAESCNQLWTGCCKQVKSYLLFSLCSLCSSVMGDKDLEGLQPTQPFLLVLPGDSPGVLAAFHCTEAEQGSRSRLVITCSEEGRPKHLIGVSLAFPHHPVLCVSPVWRLFLTP